MPIHLEIADELISAMRLPVPELEAELLRELAFALYTRWALPIGKARRMAGLTKRELLDELARRGLQRHYSAQEVAEDWTYAQSRQCLQDEVLRLAGET
jgi:predicted HTH domain antitoxin